MTRLVPALLLAAACGSSSAPSEPAPAEAPAKAEEPAEAEPAKPEGPPQRADDSTRKSKNGEVKHEVGDAEITITYGRPEARGRTVWGELVPYGKVWRTGADEASVLTTTAPVMLGAAKVQPGSYALFTIPDEGQWTVILNKEAGQWGAYEYDEKVDVARALVKSFPNEESVEAFTIEVDDKDRLVMKWADVIAPIPLKPAK